jgi:hypothetical protein
MTAMMMRLLAKWTRARTDRERRETEAESASVYVVRDSADES